MMPRITWGDDRPWESYPYATHTDLDDCRIVRGGDPDDAIALDWVQHVLDADTRGLWRFDGDLLDASPHGLHGVAHGDVSLVDGWIDGSVVIPMGDGRVVTPAPACLPVDDMTIENGTAYVMP